MKLPDSIGVMTLPHTTLFPKAMLPLHIFEPRYRQMLTDALRTHRLFAVAMREPGQTRDVPAHIAGVGMIRASVRNRDGTSNLMLQGLARVELGPATRYQPYRVHRIHELHEPEMARDIEIDALVTRVCELIAERFGEVAAAVPVYGNQQTSKVAGSFTDYLRRLKGPGAVADLAACSLLHHPLHRQVLLETLDIKVRLKRLLHFLLEQSAPKRKDARHE